MIRWEAWCYRCRGRESGIEPNEGEAQGRIRDFRADHVASCGHGVSMGHTISSVPPSESSMTLTGDGYSTGGRG